MTFTGNENQSILIGDASIMTKRYRDAHLNTTNGSVIVKGGLNTILAQAGCVGIRIYYALDSSNILQVVVTGIDANGNDQSGQLLLDRCFNCPPDCSTANALNS